MAEIKSIMCCCGGGVGSSLIVKMNTEKVLKKLGRSDIKVDHTWITEANQECADLIICGKDLKYQFREYPNVICLDEILNMQELTEKLQAKLAE